jgi:phosphohistidine phosphatase
MKTLLLMRHAKSDWGDVSLRDFDRPLAERGERDAPRMARELKARGPLPDLIISSPAVRARQTAEAVIRAAGLNAPLEFDENIYEASTSELMKVARNISDTTACAMLVGHNPGFEGMVSRLSGADERMPTAAVACIEFQVDRWEDVEDGRGRLQWLMTPRTIKD